MINKEKITGIYKITSPSGKVYIGQACNIADRKRRYAKTNCKGQRHLYSSIISYGWNNHIFEVLEECSREKLNDLEIKYISLYNSTNREIGMNLQSGGLQKSDSPETILLKRMNSPKRKEFYSERNGVVTKFNSMTEAEKILGVTRKSIREALKDSSKQIGKYSYSYEYPTTITNAIDKRIGIPRPKKTRELISNNSSNKKAIIAEKDGEIFTFNSIIEASKTLGDTKKVIGFALNNPTKTKSQYKYYIANK